MMILNDHDELYIKEFIKKEYSLLLYEWHKPHSMDNCQKRINSILHDRKYKFLTDLLARNIEIVCLGPKPDHSNQPLIVYEPLLFPES